MNPDPKRIHTCMWLDGCPEPVGPDDLFCGSHTSIMEETKQARKDAATLKVIKAIMAADFEQVSSWTYKTTGGPRSKPGYPIHHTDRVYFLLTEAMEGRFKLDE